MRPPLARALLLGLLGLAAGAPAATAGKLAAGLAEGPRLRGVYVTPYLDADGRPIDPLPSDGYSPTLSMLRVADANVGASATIVLRFHPWGEVFPTLDERILLEHDRWPLLTLMPRGITTAEIGAGAGDAYLTARAQELEAALLEAEAATGREQHALLRFAHEMNGNWYPWSVTVPAAPDDAYAQAQTDYRAAFRRVHDVFAEHAPDVDLVWAPTWRSIPATPANDVMRWYPGDAYVDWIGVTGYNRYALDWREPAELFDELRARAAVSRIVLGGDATASHRGGAKPLLIAETSSIDAASDGSGRTKADWIAELRAYLAGAPEIRAVVWFNASKRCVPGTSGPTCPLVYWRPSDGAETRDLPWEWDSEANSASAFQSLASDQALFLAGPAPF